MTVGFLTIAAGVVLGGLELTQPLSDAVAALLYVVAGLLGSILWFAFAEALRLLQKIAGETEY